MDYKSLAVIVTDQAGGAAPLAAAQALALREDAHLDVYCVGVDPARYEPLPAGAAVAILESGLAEARARARELCDWATTKLAGTPRVSVEAVVVPQLGLDPGLARLTRYADLVLCAQPYAKDAGPLQVSVLEAVLFGTGTPVLVVTPEAELSEAPRRVLLAWDESREALTAARQALPLLRTASHVDVVMIEPPSHSPERSDPGGNLAMMLSRHGVHAEVSILARTMPRVSDCLSRFARDKGSDLIVMGAYGHSRLREAMLGGPTRDMLQAAGVPLFMAH